MKWFEETYKTYYNDLYRFIYVLSGNNSIVEDIVQDTFMVLFKKQNELKSHPYIKGWLYTTARNKTWNYLKKKNNQNKYEYELSKDMKQSYYFNSNDNIYEILTEFLTEEEIDLLRLNKEYGYTAKEIAKSKGLNSDTLSKRIYRLKLKIIDELGKIINIFL